MDGINR